jgi:predicted short-subunit dehydrogenase-like oxidoreductase (DUF2520 family)
MDATPSYRRIGIVGTGRVAQAMALALHRHSGQPLLVWGRDAARCRAMVAGMECISATADLSTLAAHCDLFLIAVSDDAIAGVVADLAAILPDGAAPFILHLSGRSGAALLAPLQHHGALTAAVHPAMTFTGDPAQEVAHMIGATFVITADNGAAIAAAQQLVALLGGVAEEVEGGQRALYHAALCHAANHLVTLIAGSRDALAAVGIADPAALLGPLARAALDNSLDRGMAALSGPLLRGDADTINRHLIALSADQPQLLPAYRAMAAATLDALEKHGQSVSPALRTMLD